MLKASIYSTKACTIVTVSKQISAPV